MNETDTQRCGMSAIKLPVEWNGSYFADASGEEIEMELIAAVLNTARRRAFEELTAEEFGKIMREAGRDVIAAHGRRPIGANASSWDMQANEFLLARFHAFAAPKGPTHETQASIAAWADSVFGAHQGPIPPLRRSLDEIVEAFIAAGIPISEMHRRIDAEAERQFAKGAAEDLSNLPSEVAGLVIILHRVAQAAGFDLQTAIDAEMAKNRARPQARGDFTHIAAPEAQGGENG